MLAQRDPSLPLPVAKKAGWSDLDIRAVDTARVLAADAVQKVGNGHPGTAMSLAPLAYLLYQNVMTHDPSDPAWLGRDRFVLSCGHSSLTQYIQLYLSGYGLELDDLKSLRTWGSLTPGHPEVHHTKGVEITTGPLGSGLASAVGMAMAQRRQRGMFDPDAKPGTSPFDHHVYVIASDGDMQEGVSHEACALAAHQQLGNLTMIYDANQISIEDDTDIAFSEDVGARFAAYGWHVVEVDWRQNADGHTYVEDIDALLVGIRSGEKVTDRPTIVVLHTIIAWPSPTKQNTGKAHGSALGDDEVAGLKTVLGFNPQKSFAVEPAVLRHAREVKKRGKAAHKSWDQGYRAWRKANPDRAKLLDRIQSGAAPDGLTKALPTFPADAKGMATRAASGKVLTALADVMPELWGGSADLAGSNNTTMEGEPSFIPTDRQTATWQGGPYGRTLHFGIRENGMGMILNGMALEGLTRPYGGTFLVFSDYMRPAVRLAAIQQVPVTYVWTHDSIGVGEDGPTHQPIEHLAALRAIPGLAVVRPADANETAVAWGTILAERSGPAALCLTRQNVPTWDRKKYAKASGAARGGYVLVEESGSDGPDLILVGTGSEVQLAVEAAEKLEKSGVATRVVSMPCREWFEKQTKGYREKVLPAAVRARVSVEAGIAMGWHDIVGDAGRSVSIEHFGASADAETLFREFGITAEAVVKAGKASLKAARADRAGSVGSLTAPTINETSPARAKASANTDVMGSDVSQGDGTAAAASTSTEGK
ncbi:transketolase [Humibacillus sp. DSM 29435]|uniref:transketolase n=1 Tax=Humibacillus sp. DSM 29435 TaxID=1869167 RepID=UPI0008733A44|nr:transketolase [Humibacillus sp. DSM 29435]OFE17662.1 transketolase [Humibacillus sp. DSM 29435]